MTTMITINGLEFSGGAPGPSGFFFNKIIDWYGVPDGTAQFDDIPNGPGSFAPARMQIPQVTPSIEGGYLGASVEDALRARITLSKIRADGRKVAMTVHDDLFPTTRMVFVKKVTVPHSRHPGFKLAIDCIAPDPFRYGETVVSDQAGLPSSGSGMAFPFRFKAEFGTPNSSGRTTIYNDGSESAPVSFEVGGGLLDGFQIKTIDGVGELFTFTRNIPEDSVVTFNPRTGRAKIDGTSDISGDIAPNSNWTVIPPGESRTFQFNALGASSGTPYLIARLSPRYL